MAGCWPSTGITAVTYWATSRTLCEVGSWREVGALRGQGPRITRLAFDGRGQRLAAAGMNRTIRVWDVPSGREVCQLTGHTSWVGSLAFSPDGTRIASASDDATVRLWDAESGREVLTLHGHGASVNSVAFSRDGRWLASAGNDGTVRLWDGNPWQEPGVRADGLGRPALGAGLPTPPALGRLPTDYREALREKP